MSKEKLQWHPAFAAALRITLSEEMQYLELQEEYSEDTILLNTNLRKI